MVTTNPNVIGAKELMQQGKNLPKAGKKAVVRKTSKSKKTSKGKR
jgi:hypothetical protein